MMLPARGERGGEPTPAGGGDRSRGHGHGAADRQLASRSKVWSAKKWIYRGESKARTYHLSVRLSSPLAAESLNYSRVSLLLPDRGRDDVCRVQRRWSLLSNGVATRCHRGWAWQFYSPGRWSVERERGVASLRVPPATAFLLISSDSEENNLLEFSQNARSSKIMVIYLTKFTAVSSQ